MRVPCKSIKTIYLALTSQTAYALSCGLKSLIHSLPKCIAISSLKHDPNVFMPKPLAGPYDIDSWLAIGSSLMKNLCIYYLPVTTDLKQRCKILYALLGFLYDYWPSEKPSDFEVIIATQTLTIWMSSDRISVLKASPMILEYLLDHELISQADDEDDASIGDSLPAVVIFTRPDICVKFLLWLHQTVGEEAGLSQSQNSNIGLLVLPTFKTLVTTFAYPGLEAQIHECSCNMVDKTVEFSINADPPQTMILPRQAELIAKLQLDLIPKCRLDMTLKGHRELSDNIEKLVRALIARANEHTLLEFFEGDVTKLTFESTSTIADAALVLRKEIAVNNVGGTPLIKMPGQKRTRLSQKAPASQQETALSQIVTTNIEEILPFSIMNNLIDLGRSRGLAIGTNRHLQSPSGLSLSDLFNLSNYDGGGGKKKREQSSSSSSNQLLKWMRELDFFVFSDFLVEDYSDWLILKKQATAPAMKMNYETILARVRALLGLEQDANYLSKVRTAQWLIDYEWLRRTCRVIESDSSAPEHSVLMSLRSQESHPYRSELHLPSSARNFRKPPKSLYVIALPCSMSEYSISSSHGPMLKSSSPPFIAPFLFASPTSLSRLVKSPTYNVFVNVTYALAALSTLSATDRNLQLVAVLPKGVPIDEPCDREILEDNMSDNAMNDLNKEISRDYEQLTQGLLRLENQIRLDIVSYLWLEDSYCEGAIVDTEEYALELCPDTLCWSLQNRTSTLVESASGQRAGGT